MAIRKAGAKDKGRIGELLHQLGYPNTESFLERKMKTIEANPNSELFVYENDLKIVALISIDFIPQLALEGDFARISYLAVDEAIRSNGIGRALEELCVKLATERKCDRIELHCDQKRIDAHRFYYRQGYIESSKYLMKKLDK
jgi:GNAT superfamily N-acetyltransferase